MKKIVALALAIVLAFTGAGMPIGPEGTTVAIAATKAGSSAALSSPSSYTYTYYSDLYFKEGYSTRLSVGKAKKLGLVSESGSISWKSSNKKVATVSNTGTVTAKRAGVTRITATNGMGKNKRSVTCIVKVYKKRTQAQARKTILSLKKQYYQGKHWTNDDYYFWDAANAHCYGCVAFVGIASDKAFGKYAPFKRHAFFSRIKAGDHIRIGGIHSVIVLYKKKQSVVVAEGNYNDAINWGRTITYSELKQSGFYVETRY